jgi:GDSL-like Lipase/Acylhydrolase family
MIYGRLTRRQTGPPATRTPATPIQLHQNQEITGTWTPPSSVSGWTDIQVAIPGRSDDATAADYRVDPGGDIPGRNIQISQAATTGANTWVNLGNFYTNAGSHVTLSNVVPALSDIGVDIAWSAMAFIPETSPGPVNYVAMGDSYSAGEGLGNYLDTDGCHRSQQAYPMLVTLPAQDEPISQQTSEGFSFIACTGAQTTGIAAAAINPAGNPTPYYVAANSEEDEWNQAGITRWGYEQNATPWQNNGGPVEGLQAQNVTLSDYTALITISIGGNDARFIPIMTSCLISATANNDCSASNYHLAQNRGSSYAPAVDPEPLSQFEPKVIQYLTAHLVQTYEAINTQAPNADIIVVGYPQIFPSNPTANCDSGSYLGKIASLTPGAQSMINTLATDVDGAISTAVAEAQDNGVAIHFINPTQAFAGHALCDTDPWILPLSLVQNKAGSYHPTAEGQQEYATLVNQCLSGILEGGC